MAEGQRFGAQPKNLHPASRSLTLTGPAPYVGRAAVPDIGQLSLSATTPTVVVSRLPIVAAALALTGTTPVIGINLRPAAAALALAGNTSTLGAGPYRVVPSASLALTGPAPRHGAGMEPDSGSLGLSGNTPSVINPVKLEDFPTGQLQLTSAAPDVEVGCEIVIASASLGLEASTAAIRLHGPVNPYPNDPVNEGILETAGSDLLFRQATGFEQALADVEAQRLMAIYAELLRDQWDANKISYRNLPYLAWAMGVNLWEDWWSEEFKRYWVDKQWTIKSMRGSLPGMKKYVSAQHQTLKRAITPPALCYPLRSDTQAERSAYVARFPQLRLYPYVARETLPYLCYVQGRRTDGAGHRIWNRNGGFIGPRRRIFPTVQNQGGKYTRTSTIWDRGVETTLTMRKIVRVHTGQDVGWGFTPGVSAYDEEVILPTTDRLCFVGHTRYLGGGNIKYGVFPNARPKLRTVTIARSGKLDLVQGKAQYQTVSPSFELLRIKPELVMQRHPIRRTELYGSRKQYLSGKFLPNSNAWRNLYERWYIFDADRVPDYRRRGVYIDNARLGIPRYTAEVMIKIPAKQYRFKTHANGYVYGYLSEHSNEPVNRTLRAVTASMALRDTVLINTKTVRRLQVGDIIDASGRVSVGQLVSA